MTSEVTFTYQDYSREKSNVRFAVTQMTAANFDATNTAIDALSTAIGNVQVENNLQSKKVAAVNTFYSRGAATSKSAQRENKWLLLFEDTTLHTLFRHEVPLADLQLVQANTDYMDLSAGDGLALKTAAEAIVRSPAGNSASLASVQYVGKRI